MLEAIDHIFYHIKIVQVIWAYNKEAMGWDKCQEEVETLIPLHCTHKNIKFFHFHHCLIMGFNCGMYEIKWGLRKSFPKHLTCGNGKSS